MFFLTITSASPGAVILRDIEVQVPHHGPHHVVHIGVNIEVGLLVLLRWLEVTDHKTAILVILLGVGWHVSCQMKRFAKLCF